MWLTATWLTMSAANVWNEENADFEAERARKAKKGKGKSKGSDVDSMGTCFLASSRYDADFQLKKTACKTEVAGVANR